MDKSKSIYVVASVIVPYENGFVYVKTAKDGKWGPPGGGVKPFEDIRVAAPREVSEETNLEVVLKNIITMQYHKSEREHAILNTAYSSKVVQGTPKIIRPEEILDIDIFTLRDVRKLYKNEELRAGIASLRPLENYLAGKRLPLDTISYLFER